MKFVLASLFALAFTLVSGRAITARSPTCGTGGEVVVNNTVDYKGNSIGFVHSTCPQPGGSSNSTKRDAIEERHYDCKKDDCDCDIYCKEESKYKIYLSDCEYVYEYLEGEYPSTFTVPYGSYYSWYYGTCTIYFVNLDDCDYTACYSEVAYSGYATAKKCLDKSYGSYGGYCHGGKYGKKYEVIVGGYDYYYSPY